VKDFVADGAMPPSRPLEPAARRLVITGANGFVGRHLVGAAVEAGWEARGVVRSPSAAGVVSAAGGRPVELVGRDPGALVQACEGARTVVHLAQIGAERSGQTYEAVNVGFTERVLEAAREAGVARAIYFSGLGVSRYGMKARCTNGYFLSKLAAETLLFRSPLEGCVFRPSYVVGRGDAFVPGVLAGLAAGEVERPGDGAYRMQPIAVRDVAALVLAAAARPPGAFPTVFDLVGPEAVSYERLLERLATVARAAGRPATLHVREIPIAEAERRAREGGYRGMRPDELDCMLCDEVADAAPLASLLGRPLTALDDALLAALPPA
jgi:nucleoside-diphosphate-sugar epimerase